VITFSGAARGVEKSRDMRPGVQALVAYQHTLFIHLENEFFSTNLGKNTPKNAYFSEKRL